MGRNRNSHKLMEGLVQVVQTTLRAFAASGRGGEVQIWAWSNNPASGPREMFTATHKELGASQDRLSSLHAGNQPKCCGQRDGVHAEQFREQWKWMNQSRVYEHERSSQMANELQNTESFVIVLWYLKTLRAILCVICGHTLVPRWKVHSVHRKHVRTRGHLWEVGRLIPRAPSCLGGFIYFKRAETNLAKIYFYPFWVLITEIFVLLFSNFLCLE